MAVMYHIIEDLFESGVHYSEVLYRLLIANRLLVDKWTYEEIATAEYWMVLFYGKCFTD